MKLKLLKRKSNENQAVIEIEEIKRQAAKQSALNKFGLERFGTDNDSIKFYTGFPSYAHVQFFFQSQQASVVIITYCYASGVRESRSVCRNMLLVDEFLFFLFASN